MIGYETGLDTVCAHTHTHTHTQTQTHTHTHRHAKDRGDRRIRLRVETTRADADMRVCVSMCTQAAADDPQYAVVKAMGRKVRESSSKVGTQAPESPLSGILPRQSSSPPACKHIVQHSDRGSV